MASHRLPVLAVLACLLTVPMELSARAVALPWHARLVRSQPAANDTLPTAPAAITLWFTERVETGVTRIRLAGPTGALLAVGKVMTVAGEKPPAVMASIKGRVEAGRYTVRWTTAADDGHVMKGEFSFVVTGGRTQ